MQNYIFLIIFVLIFAFSKINRLISFVMIVGYVAYIFIINPVDNNKLYYLLTASLDFFIGVFMVWVYIEKDYINAKYIAYCSFASFFIHVYGRIIYGIEANSEIYVLLCLLVVITKITLMLIRPLNNGVFRGFDRGGIVRLDDCTDQKCNFKMQTKKGSE